MDHEQPNIVAGQKIAVILEQLSAYLQGQDIYFGHGTDNAWDEAVQLVMSAAALPAEAQRGVLDLEIDVSTAARINALTHARVKEKTPLPYLIGKAWFAGLEFKCDSRAIIPRSPMGELILNGFEPWLSINQPVRVLDLCCGGGCIGLAFAHYFPEAVVDLVDLDADALLLAQENAALLGVQDRARIYHSDLFSAVPQEDQFDIIISNPPYVNADDLAAMPAEYHHEPPASLGSGIDGLDITHRILAQAGDFLADDGGLFVELGYSWPALEQAYPRVPFTWLEFEHGGEGVFTLSAQQWQHYSESWRR